MRYLKITTIVLASTMLLMGCTQQTTSENNEDNEVTVTSETLQSTEQRSTETEQSSSISSEATEESAEETVEVSTEETDETSADISQNSEAENDVVDFEEGDALQDTIDLEGLTMETATDNPNKRVLLFSNDEGQKEYKSVFIKQKNRLKIIDIKNDDLLLNEELAV
ncbi:hypothetical protein [Tetragenococcus solitarius]|uniref:Lipoprotein n=1 Tax=Tetragenococcus solitarius TaxID=71453 RepID=A0ABN3Y770_9ENTE|nr:hypothetical protein [Tetragenococcus solitarius]